MKSFLEESGAAIVGLKSYFVKTAALWLAQEPHGGSRTGVTDGVHRLLDWLEQHLADGWLPCFFIPAINVAGELNQEQRQAIIDSLRFLRKHLTLLMLNVCLKRRNLNTLLEGGTEPLSERQLRLRLGRMLVLRALLNGIRRRPTAPCWESWWNFAIPSLARAAPRLLQWYHYMCSGTHDQQCSLLMAWSVVDPADLADGEPVTSRVGDAVTLDVTPLTRLLTDSDLVYLLGEPAAVAAWCRRERPAGLTAELDTPRGRAELLFRPELLLRAFSEAVPLKKFVWQDLDRQEVRKWTNNYLPQLTYEQCREMLKQYLRFDLQYILRVKAPEMDGPTVVATAGLWRRRLQQLLSGDRLRAAYDAAVSRWPDRWQLLQYYLAEDETDTQAGAESDEDEEKLLLNQRLFEASERHRRQQLQLSEQHRQEVEEQESRHREERKDLERRLSRRRHGQGRHHGH
ncbi:hypothetical protein FJT64_018269 [Amphibalanus amphitrite]|uniref:Uncharacterized protein n=1 Tax=Amphibalanus amphitrite TaxID=1232801 RepID=A0A6A4WVI7_AMPAM|nr:hypothetical protein FJT64_018269 [Amphibalanus amphitrite]